MSSYSSNRPAWMEKPSVWANAAKATILTVVIALVLLPFLVVLSTSLSSNTAISKAGGLLLIPGGISFDAYRYVFAGGVVTRAILVSLGITVVGTALSLTVTVLAAYGLSRPKSFAHRPILTVMLITLLFTPGIIPLYLTVKGLGLLDSYWALILPIAVNAFNLVIMRNFFMGIPQDLRDAAVIDGAGDFRILLRVVLPLSRAVVAVIGLFYAVAYWNAFFNALLFLSDATKWPLQLILRIYVLQGQALETDAGASPPAQPAIQMAVVVLAVIPVLLVFPFVQRHFTKGVTIGAVKG
jgi:putative aldouronate transport system permease protein